MAASFVLVLLKQRPFGNLADKVLENSWVTKRIVLPHICVYGTKMARPLDATLDKVAAKISISEPLELSMPKLGSKIGVVLKSFLGF